MTPEVLYELFGFYDASRCREVAKGYEVMCHHPYPFVTPGHATDELPTPKLGHIECVVLKEVANGTVPGEIEGTKVPNLIGYAGQCAVCGNVYYRRKQTQPHRSGLHSGTQVES